MIVRLAPNSFLRRSYAKYIGFGYLYPCVSLTTRELRYIPKLLKSHTPLSQTKLDPFKFDLPSGTQPGAYISAGFHIKGSFKPPLFVAYCI